MKKYIKPATSIIPMEPLNFIAETPTYNNKTSTSSALSKGSGGWDDEDDDGYTNF